MNSAMEAESSPTQSSGIAIEGCSSASIFFEQCPADVLAIVFSSLSSTEVFRFTALVTKRISSSLTAKADLWPHVVRDRLCHFVPARAFFDGPTNDSFNELQGVPMSDLYDYEATMVDAELDTALSRGGLVTCDAKWTFVTAAPTRRHGLFNDCHERLTLVSSDCHLLPEVASWSDFGVYANAFACNDCGSKGSAARQCANCGALLCLSCAVRCEVDDAPLKAKLDRIDPSWGVANRDYYTRRNAVSVAAQLLLPKSLCGFALCQECKSESVPVDASHLDREAILEIIHNEAPTLFTPVCTRCPLSRLLCPAHVDLCILQCRKCEDSACISHSCLDLPAPICNCFVCNWTVCYRDECFGTGRTMKHCEMREGCDMAFVCSVCAPDGNCPNCGGELY